MNYDGLVDQKSKHSSYPTSDPAKTDERKNVTELQEQGSILLVCKRLDKEIVELLKPSEDTIVIDKWHGGATVFLDVEEDYAIRSHLDYEFRKAVRELGTAEICVVLVGHVGCKCARISRNVDMSHLSHKDQASTMAGMLMLATNELRRVETTFDGRMMPNVKLLIQDPLVITA